MKPTEQQQAILDAAGRVLLINARAGTGKTTSLQMIASAHPKEKILYLVFNRKAREEAEGKFPENVEVRTVHSLAYSKSVGRELVEDSRDRIVQGGLLHRTPATQGRR